ncbi:MAG: lipocalin-like domain-containing protein [Acidobacteria bacterium]|nr:lipocalin-like domain-containing protein [Acidobacteriota bacterium]
MASICFAQAGKERKETRGQPAKTQTAKANSAIISKLVGSWKLVVFEGTVGGRQIPRQERVGLLMYDAAGRMSVQIMPRDRPKFASDTRLQGTDDEIRAAFAGYVAYFGSYEVNEADGVVIHHLEGSIFPNEVGRDNIRYYEFSGDQLTLFVTNMIDGKLAPKSSSTARVVWERVKL